MKDFHLLWYGVMAGMVVATVAAVWLKLVVFGSALVLSDVLTYVLPKAHALSHEHQHHRFHVPGAPWLIALAALAFAAYAWHHARKRGLIQLAASEAETRWARVRSVSKWGW